MTELTLMDFFCGAGGFSEGFRQQGFKIVQGVDIWKPAIDTFNHNFGSNSQPMDILEFEDSIEKIDALPDTNVIIGSPPCGSFSSSNISGKAEKTSGITLTKIFLRIVAVKKFQKNSQLRAWYMENVANSRNYLNDHYTFEDLNLCQWASNNGICPKEIAVTLKDNNPLIISADYGTAQIRKRVISGEIIKKGRLIIPPPTHSNTENHGLENWRTLKFIKRNLPKPNVKRSYRTIKDPMYPEISLRLIELTDHFYDSGLYESEWKQSRRNKINHPFMGKMSFPENESNPSRTITATKSGTSREALTYRSEYKRKGNGEYRTPTIREAACIMGFPITFQFLGSINNKWRLVGNAVCPSVGRAFGKQLRDELGLEEIVDLILVKSPNLAGVEDLNDFSEKRFDKPPKRVKNSRFRDHPIKEGNLTVTLSNYEIEKNNKANGEWFTSIQYGTGEGYPIQNIPDDYFVEIEAMIKELKGGDEFVKHINNGFSEKIGSAKEMQQMYETRKSNGALLEPTELVDEVAKMIFESKIKSGTFEQKERVIFKNKHIIPITQLLALYAINKISSKANAKILYEQRNKNTQNTGNN